MQSDKIKLFLQYTLPKKALSVFAGLLADIKKPWVKNYLIRHFLKNYACNMQEAVHENMEAYESFNAFFTRHLKSGARPIASKPMVSPVDGSVSELGRIEAGQLLQAKGKYYSVESLLAQSKQAAQIFDQGSFITLYLSPKDYHRVHMPCDGELQNMVHVPGQLFSVQPATTRQIPKLFARNERLVLSFETAFGPMAVVFVGATVVGKIGTRWQADLPRPREITSYEKDVQQWSLGTKRLKKGDELGYFKLGSTVILLFSKAFSFDAALKAGANIQLGQALCEKLAEEHIQSNKDTTCE